MNIKHTTVRGLEAGNVLYGSGFVVARRPWAGVRTPKGRVQVEGNYPGSPIRTYFWTPSTKVGVVLDKPSPEV